MGRSRRDIDYAKMDALIKQGTLTAREIAERIGVGGGELERVDQCGPGREYGRQSGGPADAVGREYEPD